MDVPTKAKAMALNGKAKPRPWVARPWVVQHGKAQASHCKAKAVGLKAVNSEHHFGSRQVAIRHSRRPRHQLNCHELQCQLICSELQSLAAVT